MAKEGFLINEDTGPGGSSINDGATNSTEAWSSQKITNEIAAGGGGATNPNVFVPTSVSDFTNPNPANANKIWEIQNNITITGDCDFSSCPNVILLGAGGKISGPFTLTGNNTAITSVDHESTIIDDDVTLAGTFSDDYNYWLEWFGSERHTETPNYDNKKAFDNALLAARNTILFVNTGHYYKSVVEVNMWALTPERPNTTIYGQGSSLIGMGYEQTRISALANDALGKSVMFLVREAPKGLIEGIHLEGDLAITGDKQNEFRSGITLENANHDFVVRKCKLTHFTGDGLNSEPWPDLGHTALIFEENGINESTGVDATNANFWRSNLAPIPTIAINNGEGMLTGAGFGGYSTLSDFSYKMFWYEADNTFIGATNWVYTYKDVPIPENATQYRAMIPNPIGDVAPSSIVFRGARHSKRVIIEDNEIAYNFRNGISNISQEGIIQYNWFHHNGGRAGGPSYDIDQEDGYQLLSDLLIINNVFENSIGGAITLRWVNTVTISGNIFKGNNTLTGAKQNINARESWNAKLLTNNFYNCDVDLGRGSFFTENYSEGMHLTLASSYGTANDNTFFNPRIARNGDSDAAEGESVFRDNVITITRALDNNIFGEGLHQYNTIVDFKNGVTVGTSNLNLFQTTSSFGTDSHKDQIIGMKVFNAKGNANYTGLSLQHMDYLDCFFPEFAMFRGGQRDDLLLKNNTYTRRIVFEDAYSPYTNDGSEFKTITITGGTLNSSATGVSNSAGYSALVTPARDFNLIVEDLVIDLTDAAVGYFSNFKHNGYTILRDVTFKADSPITYDVGRLIFGAPSNTCSSIVFEDCSFENVTLVPRAEDIASYTKANANMPVYADEAAAATANYPKGRMYATPTGELRKKN